MAHELTGDSRNLYAIQDPWHFAETGKDGRSVVLANPFSLDAALKESSIGASLTTARELYFGDGMPAEREAHVSATGKVLAVTPLGAPLVQYAELFEATRPLLDRYGVLLHVAGTLAEGGVAWIAGRLPEEFVLTHHDGRKDVHYPWLTVQAAHDQRVALSAFLTQFRIECANMLAAAQGDEKRTGSRVRARGTSESYRNRWETALDNLGDTLAQERLQRASLQTLAETPMHGGEFGNFAANLLLAAETRSKTEQAAMAALFGEPETRADAVRVLLSAQTDPDPEHGRAVCLDLGVGKEAPISRRAANLFASRYDKLGELFVHGQGNRGADRYDALCAVTEWVDHEGVRGHRGEHAGQTRFMSGLSGEGATLKAQALEMLTV